MKKQFSLICAFALTIAVSWTQDNVTRVSLNVATDAPITFVLFAPIDGVRIIPTDTIKVEGREVLNFALDAKGGISTSMLIAMGTKFSRIEFLVRSGDHILIDCADDQVLRLNDKTTDCAMQRAYSELIAGRSPYKWRYVRDFGAYPIDSVWSRMQANFAQEAAKSKKPFEELLKDGAIDRATYDFVSADVDYFNAMAMLSVAKFSRNESKDYYGSKPEDMLLDYPINSQSLRMPGACELASTLTEAKMMMGERKLAYMPTTARAQYAVNQIATKINDKKAVEHLVADFVLYRGINNKTHTRDIDTLVSDFRAQYPRSPYNDHLSRFVVENDNFERVISAPFDSDVLFVKDTAGIQTLADVFSKFKGKPIFVDFWFSTCGPCCREFENLDNLHKFLENNGIQSLFISVDGPAMVQNWENTIKLYNLKGSHIRVNKQTNHDMIKTHNIGVFPRYMIVDKDGNIVESNALRPSSGKELTDQITEKLNLSK